MWSAWISTSGNITEAFQGRLFVGDMTSHSNTMRMSASADSFRYCRLLESKPTSMARSRMPNTHQPCSSGLFSIACFAHALPSFRCSKLSGCFGLLWTIWTALRKASGVSLLANSEIWPSGDCDVVLCAP